MSRPPLSIQVEEVEGGPSGTVVVTPRGEIDYADAPVFREALRRVGEQRPSKLVVDLSGVDYMNTPGVATLVEALQSARRHQTRLVLAGLSERVAAVFDIARLTRVFEIVPDRSSAIGR
jgi:anti-sigma B factor antagonist